MNNHPSEQLKATLDLIPASSWYANPSGGVTFVNKRNADYRGIPSDHPLRLGAVKSAPWDSHISLLHPDDHDDARKVWSTCLKTGQAGEITFRVRNQAGDIGGFSVVPNLSGRTMERCSAGSASTSTSMNTSEGKSNFDGAKRIWQKRRNSVAPASSEWK